MKRVAVLFALTNGLLFVIILLTFVMPWLLNMRLGLMKLDHLNRRSAIESAGSHEANIDSMDMDLITSDTQPLYSESLAYTLGEVYRLAREYNLSQTDFTVFEPTEVGLYYSGRLYEVRIRAGYEGALNDFAGFIDEMNFELAVVESFMITMNPAASLTIDIMIVYRTI